jgi:hypothetical protein
MIGADGREADMRRSALMAAGSVLAGIAAVGPTLGSGGRCDAPVRGSDAG